MRQGSPRTSLVACILHGENRIYLLARCLIVASYPDYCGVLMKSVYADPAAKKRRADRHLGAYSLFQRKFDVLFGFSRNKTITRDYS